MVETETAERTKPCPGCGNQLAFGGESPDGEEEWYHVDSLEDIECPYVL